MALSDFKMTRNRVDLICVLNMPVVAILTGGNLLGAN